MSTSSIRKLAVNPLLTETFADLLKCASDFTIHLLKVGLGAITVGNEPDFYRPVQHSFDLPDCLPVATFDPIALNR